MFLEGNRSSTRIVLQKLRNIATEDKSFYGCVFCFSHHLERKCLILILNNGTHKHAYLHWARQFPGCLWCSCWQIIKDSKLLCELKGLWIKLPTVPFDLSMLSWWHSLEDSQAQDIFSCIIQNFSWMPSKISLATDSSLWPPNLRASNSSSVLLGLFFYSQSFIGVSSKIDRIRSSPSTVKPFITTVESPG